LSLEDATMFRKILGVVEGPRRLSENLVFWSSTTFQKA